MTTLPYSKLLNDLVSPHRANASSLGPSNPSSYLFSLFSTDHGSHPHSGIPFT